MAASLRRPIHHRHPRDNAACRSRDTSTSSSAGSQPCRAFASGSIWAVHVADVGCGAGEALIALASEFPRSTFVGYDNLQPQLHRARSRTEESRLSGRICFELLDAADGLPERYDIVSTFDVLHDAAGLLRAIARALKPDGTYLLLEMNCADDPAENLGPLATLLYGISMLYCLPTSLGSGGPGLGTCGCPPSKVEKLCIEAGFTNVTRFQIDNPLNILYAATR